MANNDFPFFVGPRRPENNLMDAYGKAANAFQQKLTKGDLGSMFGPGQGLLQFATGNGMSIGDETGTASISPGGGFKLAGKYNEFTVNPLTRQVGATFMNPEKGFRIGGSVGMGPEGYYDPRAELNFQIGGLNQGPVTAPVQMNSPAMPQESINPLTGSKTIIDERGYTRKVPYLFTEDVIPSPYQGPYAR